MPENVDSGLLFDQATFEVLPPTKPLVFLSHSSRDAEAIGRLKKSLLSVTGGAIDFFLSSDNVSIAPGTLWITEVFKALKRASLVFTFLSPSSLQSQWIFFEAGLARAYGKRVVVAGISGVKVGTVPMPLNLFQGINLDSPSGVKRIVEILNESFSHHHRLRSSANLFSIFARNTATRLSDGNFRYRVFSKSRNGIRAHEQIRISLNQRRMTVRARNWESVGIFSEGRYVGVFRYLRGSSPDDTGTHDFLWNGKEFIGSAKVDSGRWFTESLFWKPWPPKAH